MPALIRSKNNRPREERRQNLLFLKMMFLFAGFVGGQELGVGRERWIIYASPQTTICLYIWQSKLHPWQFSVNPV
jgi:hypothetical protein